MRTRCAFRQLGLAGGCSRWLHSRWLHSRWLTPPLPPSPGAQFGEVDVDGDMLAVREQLDPEQEQIIMLSNGCLCCTIRDDLVEMLEALVSKCQLCQLGGLAPAAGLRAMCAGPPPRRPPLLGWVRKTPIHVRRGARRSRGAPSLTAS